jgi:hypothetical protein
MIKKIVLSFCLILSFAAFSQEGTSSPYSFYGIGDVKFKGTIENNSMGGVAVFADSIHINLKNPALLSSLKLTTFSLGGSYSFNTVETYTQSAKTKRFNFDYLAVGLPFNKFAVSFGLMPYSSVGYKIQNIATTENPEIQRYNGSGGINKVFTGIGYQLTKELSVGADFQYNFGKIETTSIVYRDQVQYGTRETNSSNVSGLNINAGIAFQSKLTKKLTINSSITYTPEANLTLSNSRNIAVIAITTLGGANVVDDQDIPVSNTKLKLPSKLTIGTGIGQEKKWMVGAELSFLGTSSFGNRFNDITNVDFENSTKFNVGGYYIPKYNSFSNYLDKIVYRGGFRYETTGLVINNRSIKEQAFSFGLGLPVSGTLFSNINLGFEFGKRGTKNVGLVQENFGNVMIGLSLNDKWFQKRKYD